MAEEKLKEAFQEISAYKYALNEAAIVAFTDQKGIIKQVNKKFCDISGFSESELIGEDHRILNSGFHSGEFFRDLWRTIVSGKIWRGEVKNKAKDGSFYWVDTTIIPFLYVGGKPYQYVAIRYDITQRKLIENALYKLNEELEQKVEERTSSLASSKNQLERKNRDITDSIKYALRLQKAMLPDSKEMFASFSDSFIINIPQSIVSGDFYWYDKSPGRFIIACADCTGHGVPGAFIRIIGSQLLNEAIQKEWKRPSDLLELLDAGLNKALAGNEDETIADGMDIALCVVYPDDKKIEFAGAMSSIILISAGKSYTYRGSRFALGTYMKSRDKQFKTQEISYKSGDMLYLYSDGFKDQFGGEHNKKFMFRQQVQLFESVDHLPAQKQEEIILNNLKDWQGGLAQVDDIMIVGVRL